MKQKGEPIIMHEKFLSVFGLRSSALDEFSPTKVTFNQPCLNKMSSTLHFIITEELYIFENAALNIVFPLCMGVVRIHTYRENALKFKSSCFP